MCQCVCMCVHAEQLSLEMIWTDYELLWYPAYVHVQVYASWRRLKKPCISASQLCLCYTRHHTVTPSHCQACDHVMLLPILLWLEVWRCVTETEKSMLQSLHSNVHQKGGMVGGM